MIIEQDESVFLNKIRYMVCRKALEKLAAAELISEKELTDIDAVIKIKLNAGNLTGKT